MTKRRGWFLFLVSVGLGSALGLVFFAGRANRSPFAPYIPEHLFTPSPGSPTSAVSGIPPPDEMRREISPDTAPNRALFAAVQRNDPVAVRDAFAGGASANSALVYVPTGASGISASARSMAIPFLHQIKVSDPGEAGHREAVAIFNEFLDRGADVRATDSDGRDALFYALFLREIPLAQKVLDAGGNIHVVYPGVLGGDAVHFAQMAILRRNETPGLPLLEWVLAHGADPNVYSNGVTPLQGAALLGEARSVALLLRYHADPTLPTHPLVRHSGLEMTIKGNALTLAQRGGNEEVIHLLTAALPSLTLIEASATGNVPDLRKHLEAGANPRGTDESGMPLVALAAASGSTEAVRLLLDKGADPDAARARGSAALHRASALGYPEIVRLLLQRGANPNVVTGRTDYPDTPLTLAITSAEPDVVAALLGCKRLDLSSPGNRRALDVYFQTVGNSIPHRIGKPREKEQRGEASLQSQSRIYELLMPRFDAKRHGGMALCTAIERNQFGLATDLISRGADVNSRDRENKTVLMVTVQGIGMNLYELDPEWLKMQGMSAAELAETRRKVAEQHREGMRFLRLLLSRKPDVNAALHGGAYAALGGAESGESALTIAREYHLSDVIALLKAAGARR